MLRRKCLEAVVLILVGASVLTLSACAEQGKRQEKPKRLDTKQIARLEHQLSDIRCRIDRLRHINDVYTQSFLEYVPSFVPSRTTIAGFEGTCYANQGVRDDFRISDRVLTLHHADGKSQITGYGVVYKIEGQIVRIVTSEKSRTQLGDEVVVINREDTAASIVQTGQSVSDANCAPVQNEKPLDRKQIQRLERQLSEVRQRIDRLYLVNSNSQESTTNIPAFPPMPSSSLPYSPAQIELFTGGFLACPGVRNSFRVGDRLLMLGRGLKGEKYITGYGMVAALDGEDFWIEDSIRFGSTPHIEDEVYVINREDTPATILQVLSR